MGRNLAVVDGEQGLLLALTLAAKEKQTTNEAERDQDQHQQGDQQIDHRGAQAVISIGVITAKEGNGHFVDRVVGLSIDLSVFVDFFVDEVESGRCRMSEDSRGTVCLRDSDRRG